MRWMRWTTAALVLVSLAAAAAALAANAKPAAPPRSPAAKATDARKLERGRYLALTAGCGDCHTPGTLYGSPDLERAYSGSELGWRGPWGVSYARNLTPDLETGIGYWTEEELANTLKTGVRPDGKVLLPPMPWPNTALMTDEDRHALAAFLLSQKPVTHKVPDAVPPDMAAKATGSIIDLPPPSAWDAPRAAPPGAGK